jgi:hypothetical protein
VPELLLAIAQHRQGQRAEARRTLERARFVLDGEQTLRGVVGLAGNAATGPWQAAATAVTAAGQESPRWDWTTQLEVRVLRREAETLIEPAAPKPDR